MLYIEIIKVIDLYVLLNAQCTQFHGKWAEKDRNFTVTLMIEPVFMRATREGAKIIVVLIALVLLFKDKITAVVDKAFKTFEKDSGSIINGKK